MPQLLCFVSTPLHLHSKLMDTNEKETNNKNLNNLFSPQASFTSNNAPIVLHTLLIWLCNQSMGDVTLCCNASLTQCIVGHWASPRLAVKRPWIGTVVLALSLSLSTFFTKTFHLIIAMPLFTAYWYIKAKFRQVTLH